MLVVTAAMGAGHLSVATELARRARCHGARVRVLDLISAAGPAGERLCATYQRLLRRAPWMYGAAMEFWRRWPTPLESFTARRAGPFEQAISAAVSHFVPDVIVSTYNLASQALGRLARSGRVGVPTVTLVVDPGAHPYWIADDVELTLAPTEFTAQELRGYGARNVATTDIPLREQFRCPPSRAAARQKLGWSPESPIVAINAGSWMVGAVDRTLRAVLRADGVEAAVLCGHDERARRRLARWPGVHAIGWTAEIAQVLAAADALIDNAGGQTCWESLACHTPVLVYRPLPGHGRLNAATLERTGLARWVRGPRDLRSTLRSRCFGTAPPPWARSHSDAVTQILDVVR